MVAISRAQILKELLPGLNALFGLEYARYEQEHKEIYTEYNSNRSFEEDTKLSGFQTAPVKDEGAATLFDVAQEGYTTRYIMETISMGFALTQEAFEDNLYDSLSARFTKELARSMANTKQIKAAAPLNNAFSTYLTGDAVSLVNTAHPQITGPAVSNRPTTAADINETSLEAALIAMSKYTDDRGKLIALRPRKIVAPVDSMYILARLLDTTLRPGTSDNDINVLKGVLPGGYVINHYLTDPDAWFILTDVVEGFKYFNRVAISEDSDGDFDTGNMRYKMRERYAFGVSDYLAVYASPGA